MATSRITSDNDTQPEAVLPFVSVIIPVFNAPDHQIITCISALKNQSYSDDNLEIIIIDNGSCEATSEYLLSISGIIYLSERTPGSYAARNAGIKAAKGSIIAFTDADCIPHPDWLINGVRLLLKKPNCGIVGGQIELIYQKDNRPTALEWYDKLSSFQQEKNIKQHHFSVTANLFTFKKIFEDVGKFNASMFSGGDLEWGQRVANNGYALVYAYDAIVFHPSRYQLRQLIKKTRRIVGGLHEIKFRDVSTPEKILEIIKTGVMPPLQRIIHVLKYKEIKGMKKKAQLIFIILSLKYVSLFESIRLVLNEKYIRG